MLYRDVDFIANFCNFSAVIGPLNTNWFEDLNKEFDQELFNDGFTDKNKLNISRLVHPLYDILLFALCSVDNSGCSRVFSLE